MEELKFYNEWEPYGELCNYYVRDMVIDGVTWPAVEHYYQAQKTLDPEYQRRIHDAPTPADAKALGNSSECVYRPDWDTWKIMAMRKGLFAKFTQNPDLLELLLGTGDKYARYYTANAYTELMNIQSGKILGIGVELGIDQTGYAKVTRVYDGSPAQEAGIAVGDYITTVGDTDVKSLSGADAVYKVLQGEAGTTVTVTWLDSSAASKTAELTHSGYTSTTVDYQLLDNVGYIRIRQFDGTTPSELDYALRTLTANGAASLVFDLRDNGGGILEDAVNCIDLIAPEGTVAYAEDKNGNDSESSVGLPMVCLVNGNTASAAELFAATLRTMNGARLVGTTTMGKGTIQSSPQRLSDGSAVVITVARLVCGDGSCFDGTGLTVDVERALSAEEATNFYDYTPQTDPQVQRAVSAAQQLSGTTTLAGASSAAAADSTAASAAADDTAPAETAEGEPAEGETAASEPETAASAAE